jgi:hypothetical protein
MQIYPNISHAHIYFYLTNFSQRKKKSEWLAAENEQGRVLCKWRYAFFLRDPVTDADAHIHERTLTPTNACTHILPL